MLVINNMYYQFKKSTLKERQYFYEHEFDIKKAEAWFRVRPQFFAVDFGSETGITSDKARLNKLKILPNQGWKRLRNDLIALKPEDVYFDRNVYYAPDKKLRSFDFRKKGLGSRDVSGQLLAFDLDPENVSCPFHASRKLNFCSYCLMLIYSQALELRHRLIVLGFMDIEVMYSGRGFHVYVHDAKAYKLTVQQRKKLCRTFKGFAIDAWVTEGEIRLMRLPYSLNALVSRIVTPVKDIFNPLCSRAVIPKFLKKKAKAFKVVRL
jgi:DNA primase catalytic subunit